MRFAVSALHQQHDLETAARALGLNQPQYPIPTNRTIPTRSLTYDDFHLRTAAPPSNVPAWRQCPSSAGATCLRRPWPCTPTRTSRSSARGGR